MQGAIQTQLTNNDHWANRNRGVPVIRQYRGNLLSSRFQAIYSIAHRCAVGYEGLVRAQHPNGSSLSPAELFALPSDSSEMLELDRLCRTLHMENFSRQCDDKQWLFLNLNSQSLVEEQPDIGFTENLLQANDMPSHRVVIEILENEIHDPACLKRFIDHFRALGCLIAIDDFGAGCSNFDRIWQLEPDIVKIDRNLVHRAAKSSQAERILTGIIELLHSIGSLVIVEGIESEQEALVAIAANADMMQGFLFDKPHPMIENNTNTLETFDYLQRQLTRQRNGRQIESANSIQSMKQRFQQAVNRLRQSQQLELSCRELFGDGLISRAYLLDEAGYQIHSCNPLPRGRSGDNLRYRPLHADERSNWAHRPYHYRALETPGQTYVSQPYLSVTDAKLCVTLSQSLQTGQGLRVLCCDVPWQES